MIEIIFSLDNLFFSFFLIKKKIMAGQKTTAKFQDFHSQILLNDFDFWQFSTLPGYTRVCGKFTKVNSFAPFGLWKSWTEKIRET